MTGNSKAMVVAMLMILLGLWGCTQGNGPNSPSARLRELEAKSARLEDDYKAAAAARDLARKKTATLEEQRAQLLIQVEQLERVAEERDELKIHLAQRTTERDTLHTNLTQFSRDLQSLATRVEQVAQSPASAYPPVTITSRLVSSPK